MNTHSAQSPSATPNASIIELLGMALDQIYAANAAAAVLAERLAHVMPTGAVEEINSLLAAGGHYEAGHDHESALECLVGSLSRRADALAAAITATHEAVRL
ncbi:MAG: hypothetical protein IPJ48_11030 [Propionivibrio sp.]|uniref:Uncharacterized protein n=1 Tax=Candidatus Propionivibrio dominans TaxID=2954373 RepID=A0A9D7FKL7_9RHOO|nr:hypothetical protein [Candidatus Propionivibrio dominans]MBL0166885.1 hypothetical protein [Propionivibrio sp.]